MNRREKIVKIDLEKKGFGVLLSELRGYPDFKCINFDTGERFYLEVKAPLHDLTNDQVKIVKELISKGFEVRLAKVDLNNSIIEYYKLDENMGRKFIERVIIPKPTGTLKPTEVTKCPYCSFEWETRIPSPKSCPRCKRYLPWKKRTPREWGVKR